MITADDARFLAQELEKKRELWKKVQDEITVAAMNGESYTSIRFTNPDDAEFVFRRIWAFGFKTKGGIGRSFINNEPVAWIVDICWKKI